jgi:hypothetical protein
VGEDDVVGGEVGVVGVVGAAELELLLELGVGVGSTPVEVAVGSALAEVVAEPMTVVVGGGSELLAVAGVCALEGDPDVALVGVAGADAGLVAGAVVTTTSAPGSAGSYFRIDGPCTHCPPVNFNTPADSESKSL